MNSVFCGVFRCQTCRRPLITSSRYAPQTWLAWASHLCPVRSSNVRSGPSPYQVCYRFLSVCLSVYMCVSQPGCLFMSLSGAYQLDTSLVYVNQDDHLR